MRTIVRDTNIQPGEEIEAKIRTPKGFTLGYVKTHVDITQYDTKNTPMLVDVEYDEVKHSRCEIVRYTYSSDPIPCFNKPGTEVKIKVRNVGTEAVPRKFIAILYNENEIDYDAIKKLHLRRERIRKVSLPADTPKTWVAYTNNTGKPIYVPFIKFRSAECMTLGLKIGSKEIFPFDSDTIWDFPFGLTAMPVRAWLEPGEKIVLTAQSKGTIDEHYYDINLHFTDEEWKELDLPHLPPQIHPAYTQMPETPVVVSPTKPLPPAPPPPPPEQIPPYPTPPGTDDLSPVEPRPISATTTPAYKTPQSPIPTTINYPDEQKIVEPLPSPYGLVRPTADALGRKRKTIAAISYHAGKLDVTDANAHTIFQGYHTTRISLYAKTEAWEIKILPTYDWLQGKTIDDMDTIYLEQGERRDIDIEAREIQVTCPTANSSVTGTLIYEIYL